MAGRAFADLEMGGEPVAHWDVPTSVRITLTTALALICAAPAAATADDLRSVSGMQSHNRVVMAFTPRFTDPRMTAQRSSMAKAALAAAERDLVLVQVEPLRVIGARDDAAKLRRRFAVRPDSFRILLIGKDGRVALTEPAPIDASRLIRVIDAMPMRQEEMRRARQGKAAPTS